MEGTITVPGYATIGYAAVGYAAVGYAAVGYAALRAISTIFLAQ